MRYGRHSQSGLPPYLVPQGDDGSSYGGNSFYGSTGTPAAAGHGAALVVQEPLPRLARATALPGMHEIVSRDF
jgi:hypothetical protein